MILFIMCIFFFFNQKTAYELLISDWSSDVCSSDLLALARTREEGVVRRRQAALLARQDAYMRQVVDASFDAIVTVDRKARIVTANAGATQLFGAPADALIGTGIGELLEGDRKSVVEGKSVSVRVDLGGRRIIKKKNNDTKN